MYNTGGKPGKPLGGFLRRTLANPAARTNGAATQPAANLGPISRFTLKALQAKAISPEGAERAPTLCALVDFDDAEVVIALKEAEHRPMIEQRFPEVAGRVSYWHVHDIEFVDPSIALPLIEDRVRELIATLR